MVDIRPLPGELGAVEVLGLDPGRDTAEAELSGRVRGLLWDHAVVCLRFGGKLSDDELRAIVSMIGDVKSPVAHDAAGNAVRYSEDRQVIDAGFVLTDEVRPGLFQYFHTDDSYVSCPAAATVLHARKLPKRGRGGATCFIDMRVAYDLLEPDQQQLLLGLRAVHGYNNHDAFPPRPSATGDLECLVEVAHPIVRAHPVTGRAALYFDLDRATHVEGVPEADGRALLQWLQDHAEQRAPRYCHEWHTGDVMVWDNAAVQHRASGDFPAGEPRRFWRYMVDGPRPEAYAAVGRTPG